MLERLEPVLDTLVLQQEDLSRLPGHYEPCQGGEADSLTFEYSGDVESLEIEEVGHGEAYDGPIDYSSFCDDDSGAFASSLVALPRDKELLLFWQGVNTDLARSSGGDLKKLAAADELPADEELLDYRTLSAPAFGDSQHVWVRTVDNLETGQRFEIYDFDFTRGVLLAGLGVELPSSPTAEEEAFAVAQAFHSRIAARLESLAAEVRAP